ncbi:cysteine hydrolase [Bacillus sp. M6-12]|uniref:isochorismatase family cysteine hydrolase n=1 Tax=Bacillus sp. M6-12 TaxID=2054166 RepID=UPI000C75EA24|nr:isochorismatase family cysteine hydrolase [Bacillus sp. M6-12]PLS19541.1 cysteine hydrolase [Bacillus sp. M6-12]
MSIVENKRKFLKEGTKTLDKIVDSLENLPVLKVEDLSKEDTAVIVIDMINGFAKEGALASNRVEGIIPYLVEKLSLFEGYNKVFFADEHNEKSIEFGNYPAHCLKGSKESEVIEELQPFVKDLGEVIPKNSTNGFVTKGFAEWLGKHPKIRNFVIFGDCTDLCVLQFSLTLKAYLNEWDTIGHVIVPVKGVETFHLDATNHHAELMNVFAFYNMRANGIDLAGDIR